MKKLFTALLTVAVAISAYSQSNPNRIKVSEDIELIKITENAYIHISYADLPEYGRVGANGLILIDHDEAFLFDSPWTNAQTEQLYSWLKDSMDVRITGFVPNHWHEDCMGGLEFLQANQVQSYANQMTLDIAKSKGLPAPGHGFADSLELHLGNTAIHLYYPGPAHSMDNIVVWIPALQILFPGCTVKSLDAGNLGNTADGDTASYPDTMDAILNMFPDAFIVIPGHGQYGGNELLEFTKKLTSR